MYDLKVINAKTRNNADLVILQDKDVYHAIWHHKEPLVVIKNGKIIDNYSNPQK